MAKVIFGNGVSGIRGSIAGNTYSRNSSGAYIRNRATPINPATTLQKAVRLLFGAVAQAWRALTDEQRQSFDAYAPQYPSTDSLGQAITRTGQQLYMALNNKLRQYGQPAIDLCLPPESVSAPAGNAVADISDNVIQITALSATGSSDVIGVYATAPQSAGKKFIGKSDYRLIKVKPDSTGAGTFDITAEYASVFGVDAAGIPAGQKIFFKMERVSLTNGQPSVANYTKATVVA